RTGVVFPSGLGIYPLARRDLSGASRRDQRAAAERSGVAPMAGALGPSCPPATQTSAAELRGPDDSSDAASGTRRCRALLHSSSALPQRGIPAAGQSQVLFGPSAAGTGGSHLLSAVECPASFAAGVLGQNPFHSRPKAQSSAPHPFAQDPIRQRSGLGATL